MRTLTREQVRRVDAVAVEQWGVSSLVLMENAGRSVVDRLCQLGIRGRVIVACARGNNAGDGFVVARHLHIRGKEVEVLLCADPAGLSGDARANFALLRRTSVVLRRVEEVRLDDYLNPGDWVVDALLGTGAQGAPRHPLDDVVHAMNAAPGRRFAVDLPSGLNCDTGVASAATFRADVTGTFVACKPGLLEPSARPFVGQICVLDIGLPEELIAAALSFRPG